MNNNRFFRKSIMKHAIVIIAIVAGLIVGCRSVKVNSYYSEFKAFEKEFAKSLSLDKDAVKLIGFRTVTFDNDSIKQHFKRLINEYGEEMRKQNIVFSEDFSLYRQYFPIHTAIVDYNGKTYEADEKGVVSIPNMKDINKIRIIGRKSSGTVYGTGSNIIEKDRILLKNALKMEVKDGAKTGYSIEGNICVFNMGGITEM